MFRARHSIATAQVVPVLFLVAGAVVALSAIRAKGQPIPYGPDSGIASSVPTVSGSDVGTRTGSIGPAGLTIVPTFDPSITSLPGAAGVEAAINAAISAVEANITSPNNITVPIYFTNGGGWARATPATMR